MSTAERARENRRYGIMTAGVLITLAALSFTVWWFRPPNPDPETLCPTTRPITAHTVVVVDRTDRWNPSTGEALRELIEEAQRETQQYEKFSIVSLDSDLSTRPIFSVCNPGEPTFLTDLYRGHRYTVRDFEERFVGAAERVVAEVREPAEASTSPIVEYVHRWLGRDDFNAEVPNRRLVLISDMRQNSEALSVYAGRGEDLAQLVEREFGAAGRGVAFDVYFVPHGRDYNVSESEVRDAWDAAFRQINASYEWRQID
ncbi:MAG: hypothetical protein AB7J28_14115 [Hyphomonadaceae bacterium]